jgi:pantothenate kinase
LSTYDIRRAAPESSPQVVTATLEDLVLRARTLAGTGRRHVLGISGSPGAGKSTLCTALLAALGDAAVLVGMDGFHLANHELSRLGRRDRKGAPDTFDVEGYVALLRRLRTQSVGSVIYAPAFDRRLEESIGSAVPVSAETPLVVTEGNYLLLDGGGWEAVRDCLDEVWFLEVDSALRSSRLVQRRESFGDSAAHARAWVNEVDEVNASLVAPNRHRADLVVRLATQLGDRGASLRTPFPSPAPSAGPVAPPTPSKENPR